jgi:heat shock protein HslJ
MARRLIIAAVLLVAVPAAAQAASPLAGTSWVAKRIDGRVLPPGYRAELTFKAHHRFAGRIDCNRIGGRYSAGASRLRFREVYSTAVGCEGSGSPPDFGRAMSRTRSYRLTPHRLVLLGAHGRTLARLARR